MDAADRYALFVKAAAAIAAALRAGDASQHAYNIARVAVADAEELLRQIDERVAVQDDPSDDDDE